MTVDTDRIALSLGLGDDTAAVEPADDPGDDSSWPGERRGTGGFDRPLARVPTSADEDVLRRTTETLPPREA